mmetsp:Transcript_25282/g.57351  ORF Transcript_25282/g.57351 Transcript_25282/m.57351 type:complete len:135 (-) Transcript_25282:106-510(-)
MALQWHVGTMIMASVEFMACLMEKPFTHLAAGALHTLLLKSVGIAVAYGSDDHDQCRIPGLVDGGATYTQVSAEGWHTVLLKSDGTAVACGNDDHGQCRIHGLLDGETLHTFSCRSAPHASAEERWHCSGIRER